MAHGKLLERVLDTGDLLAGHVRHIWISPFRNEEYFHFKVSPKLMQAFSGLKDLQSLRYA